MEESKPYVPDMQNIMDRRDDAFRDCFPVHTPEPQGEAALRYAEEWFGWGEDQHGAVILHLHGPKIEVTYENLDAIRKALAWMLNDYAARALAAKEAEVAAWKKSAMAQAEKANKYAQMFGPLDSDWNNVAWTRNQLVLANEHCLSTEAEVTRLRGLLKAAEHALSLLRGHHDGGEKDLPIVDCGGCARALIMFDKLKDHKSER